MLAARRAKPRPYTDPFASPRATTLRLAQSAKIAKVSCQPRPMKNSVAAGEGATRRRTRRQIPGGTIVRASRNGSPGLSHFLTVLARPTVNLSTSRPGLVAEVKIHARPRIRIPTRPIQSRLATAALAIAVAPGKARRVGDVG